MFQGGRTRTDLGGWDGKAALDLAWSGDVSLLVPQTIVGDSGDWRHALVAAGSSTLRKLRDSGLRAHGLPPDSLHQGGRYPLGEPLVLTGVVPHPVEYIQSSCRVCGSDEFFIEHSHLTTSRLPWNIRLNSAILWDIPGDPFQPDPAVDWRMRVHAARVGLDAVEIERFDVGFPPDFVDSGASPWIEGFSPWRIGVVRSLDPHQPLPPMPRCTTSAPFHVAWSNGWKIAARGIELLPGKTDSGDSRSRATSVPGLGVMTPAALAIPGSLVEFGSSVGGRSTEFCIDSFAFGFDRTVAFGARTSGRDTVGNPIVDGNCTFVQGTGLDCPELSLSLRPGWLQGEGGLSFGAALLEWEESPRFRTIHATMRLGPDRRIPRAKGAISGAALIVETVPTTRCLGRRSHSRPHRAIGRPGSIARRGRGDGQGVLLGPVS